MKCDFIRNRKCLYKIQYNKTNKKQKERKNTWSHAFHCRCVRVYFRYFSVCARSTRAWMRWIRRCISNSTFRKKKKKIQLLMNVNRTMRSQSHVILFGNLEISMIFCSVYCCIHLNNICLGFCFIYWNFARISIFDYFEGNIAINTSPIIRIQGN